MPQLCHGYGEEKVSARFLRMLSAACSKASITHIDVSEQQGGTSGASLVTAEVVSAVCQALVRDDSKLRVLRMGGNGAWGEGAFSPLEQALRSPACILEELDASGCGVPSKEAVQLASSRLTSVKL